MIETQNKTPNISLFTIGFSQKSAGKFFELLQGAGIKIILDIRLNNKSQLAGFTKKGDFEYFLKTIAHIDYKHLPELAPDINLLHDYQRKAIAWEEYERRFLELLISRNVQELVNPEELNHACLLCSEATPQKCHRRLVAEYFASIWPNIIIKHL